MMPAEMLLGSSDNWQTETCGTRAAPCSPEQWAHFPNFLILLACEILLLALLGQASNTPWQKQGVCYGEPKTRVGQ